MKKLFLTAIVIFFLSSSLSAQQSIKADLENLYASEYVKSLRQNKTQIQYPCASGATPFARVRTFYSVLNIDACAGTTVAITGGALTFNGVPLGGSGISGSGTANTVAKFTGATSAGNSSITDNGSTTTFGASQNVIFNSTLQNNGATFGSGLIFNIEKSSWSLPTGGGYLGILQGTSATDQALRGFGVYVTNLNGNTKTGFAGEFSLTSNGSQAQSRYALQAFHLNNASVTNGQSYALTATMTNSGAAFGSDMFGGSIAFTNVGGGSGTLATALRVQYVNSNGTIATGRGISISHHQNNTGTTTEYDALFIDSNTNIGATTNFAIRSDSTAQSLFSGNVRQTNNKFIQGTTTGAVATNLIGMDASNKVIIGATGNTLVGQGSTRAKLNLKSTHVSSLGDIDAAGNSTAVVIDDAAISVTALAQRIGLSLTDADQKAILGDVNNVSNQTKITVDGSAQTIVADANTAVLSLSDGAGISAIGDVNAKANNTAIAVDDALRKVSITNGIASAEFDRINSTSKIGDVAASGNGTIFTVDDSVQTYTMSALTSCTLGVVTNGSGVLACAVSDEKSKDIKSPFTKGLSTIQKIQPQMFSFKKDHVLFNNGLVRAGFIAQNVEKVLPEAVSETGKGEKQIDTTTIVATLVNAVKEQQLQIEALKAEIANLKSAKTTKAVAKVKRSHRVKR